MARRASASQILRQWQTYGNKGAIIAVAAIFSQKNDPLNVFFKVRLRFGVYNDVNGKENAGRFGTDTTPRR